MQYWKIASLVSMIVHVMHGGLREHSHLVLNMNWGLANWDKDDFFFSESNSSQISLVFSLCFNIEVWDKMFRKEISSIYINMNK